MYLSVTLPTAGDDDIFRGYFLKSRLPAAQCRKRLPPTPLEQFQLKCSWVGRISEASAHS